MDTYDNKDGLVLDGPHVETLEELCGRVIALDAAYEDVAERIEGLAYHECGHGGMDEAVRQLENVARFFEGMRNKNEEISRDLAQVYLLIGQVCQYAGMFAESIEWLKRSVVVDDMYSVPYHSIALSYQSIGDADLAVKSLEQEITVAPGNYYTYMLLADLYEKSGRYGAMEEVLKRLLERDPGNMQGIHRLIRYYERTSPNFDVGLLRRRLLERTGGYSRTEAIIRAYHLCVAGRCGEAIDFLAAWSAGAPDVSIVNLAKAHIYDITRQYSQKRLELSHFKKKNQSREDAMDIKLAEFASVFGEETAENLRRGLRVAHCN